MAKENKFKQYNVIGMYCTGFMCLNYISCIKNDLGANKDDRHLYNRMIALEKEMKSMLGPVLRHVKANGGEDDMDDMISRVHELIDPILSFSKKKIVK